MTNCYFTDGFCISSTTSQFTGLSHRQAAQPTINRGLSQVIRVVFPGAMRQCLALEDG
ncbi:MAG TPA: hypothetical protein IGS37_03425 [Synechococcales cyanobacterium M55_K2018_004]|nr:hypothetical protein [Synechococcales cyanobacterium M55_K2018_004]